MNNLDLFKLRAAVEALADRLYAISDRLDVIESPDHLRLTTAPRKPGRPRKEETFGA